jgi:acetylornithine deacetylase
VLEDQALAALDPEALAADVSAVVRVPSITGGEREVLELLASLAAGRGLESQVVEHDLAALRANPGHPGEEIDRGELFGVVARARGATAEAPRLALNGHMDVVQPGAEAWSRDPWSGEIADGRVHGRGSVDMKGAVTAAMHAMAAVADCGEEDGGLGTFAALDDDSDLAGAVVVEPTSFDVACAQGGALTFTGVIPGVSAHAAIRLEGVSALDRYIPVHAALAELERELNRDVAHPLMKDHRLPYAVSVGRLDAGVWASTVPDHLVFEGRVGVPVGVKSADIRKRFEATVRAASPEAVVSWTGGRFESGETPADHPFSQLVLGATGDELGRPANAVGVSYGADMRLYTEKGIPCVMVGTPGLERAHAVDEWVGVDDLVTLARILVRVICRFGA